MKRVVSLTRRAIEDYSMIEEGDKIAVGISGGKDSLVLAAALAELSRYYPKRFEVIGLTPVSYTHLYINVCYFLLSRFIIPLYKEFVNCFRHNILYVSMDIFEVWPIYAVLTYIKKIFFEMCLE